ncbi:MAG TPA: trehalose-phosphatase [Vicinamibacterales bacterium]|nr:trehalose-phosphatase [Vicinamibacterales bacterium]
MRNLARTQVLLVASGYDGTLAPLVSDPSVATPHPETVAALTALTSLPRTAAALISGRSLRDLAAVTKLPGSVHLVGSHGSEFDSAFADSLTPEQIELRRRIIEELTALAEGVEGLRVEVKPASAALHYRNVSDDVAASVLERVRSGPATWEGVYVREGRKVIELGMTNASKGEALRVIRERVGATAVIYFGDDPSDESAFAVLHGRDVGVKIGDEPTLARHRLRDPVEVAAVLAKLFELRSAWLESTDVTPIEKHSLLSDHRTAALVTPEARVVWFCVPRLDSPAIFAELLGGPTAGYFSVQPANGGSPISQCYIDDALVLETRWPDLTVTDFLDVSGGRPAQRAGRTDLVRILEGRGRAVIEFAPRLDFGRVPTSLEPREGGLIITGSFEPLVLRSPGVQWELRTEGHHQTARAVVDLSKGPVVVELVHGSTSTRRMGPDPRARLDATRRWWSSWASGLVLPEVEPEIVRRSALILKGLFYESTGAFAAAATTSLPETIGGVRNWDYRYCWLRDAALSAAALVRLGSTTEAMRYLDWVLAVLDHTPSPDRLQPLYTLAGTPLGPEAEISELAGYRGSRPVRIGNAASMQLQLDVFGPIVDLIALLAEHYAPLSGAHWRLVDAMVQAVSARWTEPDYGIWEIRRPRRHHVHSKVMCWVTIDRAMSIAANLLEVERPEWGALRQRIADDIIQNGYDPAAGTFKAAYDGTDIDAAALHVGLSGLLPPDDPRFHGTIAAVERELLDGPVVYRYRSGDGLPGIEGGFNLCTAWLVQAYLLAGRIEDARSLYERMASLVGPTGLMSEEYDPIANIALGNVPQAYSHVGLIDCAVALAAHQAGVTSMSDR